MNGIEQILINSFMDYMSFISANCAEQNLFRGIHNQSYKLVPKIGRECYSAKFMGSEEDILNNLQDLEEQTMHRFVDMSVPYLDLRNMSSWDQWTIGQHHGVPTRFLDWTQNPLIAAYFAIEGGDEADAAVYIINRDSFTDSSDVEDLFSAPDEIVLHIPSYINPRIIAQKGVFTVHKNPLKPIDSTLAEMSLPITKVIIPHTSFNEIRNRLDWCGINRYFVYPGLDGLASYLDLKAQQ